MGRIQAARYAISAGWVICRQAYGVLRGVNLIQGMIGKLSFTHTIELKHEED